MRKTLLLLLAVAALAGCGTAPVNLAYNPAGVVKPASAKPDVELFSVSDARKNAGNRVGTIRGGYGNPLRTLETPVPVREVVRKAFVDGLAARGLLASENSGRYGMDVAVERLDSNHLVRREAHSAFRVSVIEKATGRQVYSRIAQDDRNDQGTLATGILSDPEDLRAILNASMQASVDQALDNPALLTAIGAR